MLEAQLLLKRISRIRADKFVVAHIRSIEATCKFERAVIKEKNEKPLFTIEKQNLKMQTHHDKEKIEVTSNQNENETEQESEEHDLKIDYYEKINVTNNKIEHTNHSVEEESQEGKLENEEACEIESDVGNGSSEEEGESSRNIIIKEDDIGRNEKSNKIYENNYFLKEENWKGRNTNRETALDKNILPQSEKLLERRDSKKHTFESNTLSEEKKRYSQYINIAFKMYWTKELQRVCST